MSAPSTFGLVLAGGRSRRFRGADKVFVELCGRPLWQHVLTRLAPQVDAVAISSNAPSGNFAVDALDPAEPLRYRHRTVPSADPTLITVLPDLIAGSQGPLAGIHAGLSAWPKSFVVTVAVDLPFVPMNLVARLAAGLIQGRCAYATDGTRHALALLWAPGIAGDVAAFLERGGRSVYDWLAEHGDPVPFTAPDDSDLFSNINTPEDLAVAERRLCGRSRI